MSFSIINKEKQYQGRAFDVSKVFFHLPNGDQKGYDLVEHGDSVTIIPVDEDGQMYFVSQYRIGSSSNLLELPAGVLEDGEDPMVCAMREIREEIGKASYELKKLGGFYLAPGYTNEYMTVFLASSLFDSPLDPDADEFLDIVTIPTAEAYQKAVQGEFNDGKTLAALLLALPYLNTGLFQAS